MNKIPKQQIIYIITIIWLIKQQDTYDHMHESNHNQHNFYVLRGQISVFYDAFYSCAHVHGRLLFCSLHIQDAIFAHTKCCDDNTFRNLYTKTFPCAKFYFPFPRGMWNRNELSNQFHGEIFYTHTLKMHFICVLTSERKNNTHTHTVLVWIRNFQE